MNFFVLPNTKEDILKKVCNFHSRKKKYYGSQWCPRTALFPTFFRISSFVFSRTKTFIQVWNYLRVSKWWQNFHFWVNYPFKRNTVQCISPIKCANLHTLTEIKSKQAELFMTRRSVCSVGLVMICPLTSHRTSAIHSPAERSQSEPFL